MRRSRSEPGSPSPRRDGARSRLPAPPSSTSPCWRCCSRRHVRGCWVRCSRSVSGSGSARGASRPRSSVLLAAVPAVVVAGWAFTRPALVDVGRSHSERVHDGAIFGVLVLVGLAAAVAAPPFLARRLVAGRERLVARALAGGALAAIVVGLAAVAVVSGDPVTKAVARLLARGMLEQCRPARVHEQQPPEVVARGRGRLLGEAGRRGGRRHLRDRPQAVPPDGRPGRRAALGADAGARGHRDRRWPAPGPARRRDSRWDPTSAPAAG